MKAPHPVTLLVGLLAISAMTSAFAQINYRSVPRARVIPTITGNQFVVTGEVVRRSELEFTVLDRSSQLTTLHINEDTELKRAGALIKLPDLVLGDKVTASVMRGGDGRLQAVRVTVRVGNETL